MLHALGDTFLSKRMTEDIFNNFVDLMSAIPADPVNHPPHYTVGAIECIDAIRAALTDDEFRGYCKGNALKYVWRERHKGQTESLQKAEWYLKRISQCPPPSPAK